jgi:DNA polymerase III delta prime subunit
MKDLSLWVDEFDPNTIESCILPDHIKDMGRGMVESGAITNLLLCGDAGVGKTSFARALCNDMGCEYIMMNGSNGEVNVEWIRERIGDYAQTLSLDGSAKPKVVIIDEADGLSPAIQGALRSTIEKFSNGCRFILTCNHPDKIIKALKSRCPTISFAFSAEEKNNLVRQVAHKVLKITKDKAIQCDTDAVVYLVKQYYPDVRRIFNEAQRYININTSLDIGIQKSIVGNIEALFKMINLKDFMGVKQYAEDNALGSIFATLYKECEKYIPVVDLPRFIYTIGSWAKYHESVPSQELNFVGCMAEFFDTGE